MMKVISKMPSYWTFLNLHRLNSNSFTRWFFIEAISIGHYIYSASYIRIASSNQNLLNFSGELESPPWKKTSLNRACRRNWSKNRKHTCATLDDGSEASWLVCWYEGFCSTSGRSAPRYCKNSRIYRLSSWPQSRLIGWHKRVMALIGLFL